MKFSNLKRQDVRKVIKVEEGEDILIYNPNKEQKNKIIDMFTDRMDEKTGDINISDEDVLLTLIPMLVKNIELDLDKNNEEDLKIIKDILADPSDLLLEVADELNILIREITLRVVRKAKEYTQLTDDEKLELTKVELKKQKKENIKIKQLEEAKKKKEELENEIKKLELEGKE